MEKKESRRILRVRILPGCRQMFDQGDCQGVGWKDKAVIIWYLKGGAMRFGEIGRVVPEATLRILSKQLRGMDPDGLVRKVVYPEVPPRTE